MSSDEMKGEQQKVERKTNTEKRQSSVIRRKKNGTRPQNKELRQSMCDLSGGVENIEITDKPVCRLRRSRSFHQGEHLQIQPKSSREMFKQYVANIHDVDLDTFDHSHITIDHHDDEEFPLHVAIEKHNIKDLAIYLLKNENLNIEQKNNFGQTPLIYAVSLGIVDVVKLLIASGAAVNCKDSYGVSALRYAVEEHDFDIAALLISHGASAEAVQNGM